MNEVEKRLIVAICQVLYLQEAGKEVQRAEDWQVISEIARTGEVPAHIIGDAE